MTLTIITQKKRSVNNKMAKNQKNTSKKSMLKKNVKLAKPRIRLSPKLPTSQRVRPLSLVQKSNAVARNIKPLTNRLSKVSSTH